MIHFVIVTMKCEDIPIQFLRLISKESLLMFNTNMSLNSTDIAMYNSALCPIEALSGCYIVASAINWMNPWKGYKVLVQLANSKEFEDSKFVIIGKGVDHSDFKYSNVESIW